MLGGREYQNMELLLELCSTSLAVNTLRERHSNGLSCIYHFAVGQPMEVQNVLIDRFEISKV